MRKSRLIPLAAAACTLAAGTATAAGGGINWVDQLPPVDVASDVQPGPVPHCKKPRPKCVKVVIRRLAKAQRDFGCDHRAVFATTYLTLTRVFFRTLRKSPGLLDDPKYLFTEDGLFANYYFRVLRADKRGQQIPEAWRIAFDTAATGEVNAAQDMLLGINAHVQSDMPFVLAELGLETPDGRSRKPDHDVVNEVLEESYARVVAEVRNRYDPLVGTTNSDLTPLDDVAGLELVRSWRERVWRNAERLTNASTEAERNEVAESIEADAADWARGIASVQSEGDRARRAPYCEAYLAEHPSG